MSRMKQFGIKMMLVLVSLIIVPVCGYLVGGLIVGPYEGSGGLPGYLGQIISRAFSGERSAWILMLTPAIIVSIWSILIWQGRRQHAKKAVTKSD